MDTFEMMRIFAAVARDNSFTQAGQRLGISTKLVSKYVARLEDRLGAQLFNRTTRSVSLTELGVAYLERCEAILDQMRELDDLVQARQTHLTGPIHVAAPTGFGATWLSDALIPFLAENDEVNVELHLSDVRVALVEEGFDLAVRIGPLRDSTLIARKLADMPLITCAAPSYLATNGSPGDPAALATHTCIIDSNISEATSWHFTKGDRSIDVKVSGQFRANAPSAITRLALGGIGIARIPLYQAQAALSDGRLVQLFPDFQTELFGVHALYPPNRHLTARVRALIDHLVTTFSGAFVLPEIK